MARHAAFLLVALLSLSACTSPSGAPDNVLVATPRAQTDVPEMPAATDVEALEPTDAPALAVKITKLTKSVGRGGTASVTIKTTKKAECSIDVQYNSGSSTAKGLGDKTANASGVITWKWTVGSRTAKDSYPISIWCSLGDRVGSADATFTVK